MPKKHATVDTNEELYKDFLVSMLGPYINEAIENYYGYPKSFTLWDAEIIDVTRLEPGSFYFEIVIQVVTFKGAHNPPYGKETITIRKDYSGILVTKFTHEEVKINN